MNARTTRRLTFQPVPGVAQNTRGASLPAGTPVHYDGARLLANVDGQNDYELTAPEQGDYEMDDNTQNPFATATDPALERHHWQNLFGLINSLRPEWGISQIANTVFGCRDLLPFPELVATAVRTAQNPRFKGPGAIRLVLTGMVAP
ncbi:hypothetical protein [Arthrobacter sp. NPDC056493]|uniref:hypothetical protein n=1 Tax=Arthrobacter sp. NPDC056493 TaxID=3345839 RepID=UPI00366C9217